jgi:hypothetical protein
MPMVRFVTQSSGTYRDVPGEDDAVIPRESNAEKHTMAMIYQQATAASMAISGRGSVGRNDHATNPVPPSVDRRFEKYAPDSAQQQQHRGVPLASTLNKSALTKVQHYVMASRMARQQDEMQKAALKAQQQTKARPPLPLPPPQQMVVRKQRVITPEMVARRPVESKHNIMMRSRHNTCNDSVSNSVVSDSTNQIENTKKACAQRKRDEIHCRSTMERNANMGVSTPAALAQLVAALSVSSSNTKAKDNESRSTTVATNLPSNDSPSAKNTSSPLVNDEFKRSLSTKSDVSGFSIITEEEEITRKPSLPRSKHAGVGDDKNFINCKTNGVNNEKADIQIPMKKGSPKDAKNSIDSQTNGVISNINSKASNLIPKKSESPRRSAQLKVDTDMESTQPTVPKDDKNSIDSQADGVNSNINSKASNLIPKKSESPKRTAQLKVDTDRVSSPILLSTKSNLSKDSLVTEAEIDLQLSSPRDNNPFLQENNKSIGHKSDGASGSINYVTNDLISKKKQPPKGSTQLKVVTQLQPAQPSSILSPVWKEDIETQLPLLSLEPQIPFQPVTNVESNYGADDSEDGKDDDASGDYGEESESSPKVSSLDSAKLIGGGDYSDKENHMKFDTKSNKKIHLRVTPPDKSCAKEMDRVTLPGDNSKDSMKMMVPKMSTLLDRKSKASEDAREYAAEEEEEYRVGEDDAVSDEPKETNQAQRYSTTPPKKSRLLGKKSKDSKKMIPKKTTLLGRKSKASEDAREYAAEEEEEYFVDEVDAVSDEPEETNRAQRYSTTPPKRSRLLGKNSKDSKMMVPKKSSLLGRKSKLIEDEKEYVVEEEEEYFVDEDDAVSDEPKETNQAQRNSRTPPKRSRLLGKNSKDSKNIVPKKTILLDKKSKVIEDERAHATEEEEEYFVDEDDAVSDEPEESNQVQRYRYSIAPPKRSRLLGKNSKDPKKILVPKKTTLLGRKSKVIEEEREYVAEKEEVYRVNGDDEMRDEPEETNQLERYEEESPGDSFSSSMKSTLSKAEYISVDSSITMDQYVFAQKAGVLTRTASLVKNPGRTIFNRTRSKAEKEGEELMKGMRHGMTIARADNRKKEHFSSISNPVKDEDCTPDSEELVYGITTKVLDNNVMLNNNLVYDGDSMYEDNTDFIPKTVATKSRGAINSGTQTRMNEHGISYPIIRNVSSGIKELSSFLSLKETATQTSTDQFIAPIISFTSPAEIATGDDFVLPPPTYGPEIIKSEVGTVSHLMESLALCGAKVCMGTSNAMLSCADSCSDDPQGRKMTVLSPRHNVAPVHIVRQSIPPPEIPPQRCAVIPSCYNSNSEPQPLSNSNNTDQEVAGIFTRAFAMALNGMNNGESDKETTRERESPRKQQNTESPQPYLGQHANEPDKLDDFLSVDGMFMSPNRQHGRHPPTVPHKIAVKPKKRRHAAGMNEIGHHAALSPRKSKKPVQKDEMKNCVSWSDQMDNLGQDLTRTNSLVRASSNGSRTGKSKGVRGFFNRMGNMKIGFTYEV